MTDFDTDIAALNNLIETTIDSADGYEQASAVADDTDLAHLFRSFAAERRQIVTDLRTQVIALGGDPEADGTLLASAHRVFLRIKASFGSSREAVISEVEAGEDHIKAKYDAVLESGISPATRAVVTAAYASVREGHDTFATLKHAYI